MRKLMTAVTVLVGLSMAAGCRSSQDEARDAHQDMAQADQKANQDVANAQQELAERTQDARENAQQEMADARADAQNKMQDAQQERAEEKRDAQQELNDAQAKAQDERRDQAEDANDDAIGGSGPATTTPATSAPATTAPATTAGAATKTITGTLASSLGKQLTVKDAKDAELKLDTDDSTRVLYQGKQVKLDDFEKGTRLSATYEVQGDKKLAREVTITAPAKKK